MFKTIKLKLDKNNGEAVKGLFESMNFTNINISLSYECMGFLGWDRNVLFLLVPVAMVAVIFTIRQIYNLYLDLKKDIKKEKDETFSFSNLPRSISFKYKVPKNYIS